MTDDLPGGPDPDMTAAELALGLLEGEARADALRRVLFDRDFARDVDAWRDHFALLLAAYPAVDAPASAWPAIERRLDGPLRRSTPLLALAASLVSALAAALLVFVLMRGPEPVPPAEIVEAPEPAPLLAAPLSPGGEAALLLATYDAAAGALQIAPSTLATAGRTPQLWVIPGDGTPRSLGLISADARTQVPLTAELKVWLVDGATLAVSLEPAGGSPTGQPTGPVVASGKLSTI